jgi:porin
MGPDFESQSAGRRAGGASTPHGAKMRRLCRLLFAGLVTLILAAAPVVAAEPTICMPNQYPSPTVKQPASADLFDQDYPWNMNTLTGDWGGLRSRLAQSGIVVEGRYVAVLMDNTQGGFDTGFFGGEPLGVTATVDMDKFANVDGGTLFFDWEFFSWYNGRFPNNDQFDPTGSYVGINTNLLDGDDRGLNHIAQLYYEQSLADDCLSFTFGKMDANVPFAVVQAAGAFQNSIAMFTSTLNPFIPSYENEATALVARAGDINYVSTKFGWFDGTSAAYDPVTGKSGPDTGPRGPSTFFNNKGNWFLISQTDFAWTVNETLPGSIGAGAWLQTGLTATAGTNKDGVRDVPGCYLQWQQIVWAPSEDVANNGGGLAYYGQFGWSDPNKNPIHWSLMTGVSATGVLRGRPADAAGLMFAYSRFTDDPAIYQSTRRNGQPGPSGGSELSIESLYIWQTTSWSYVQPGIMWVANPGGGDPAPLNDDLVLYLLVGVEL